MTRRQSYLVVVLVLAACLPAAVLQARVFRSGGGSPGRTMFKAEDFGKRLYRTVMRLNGGKAEVNVVSCREGLEGVRQSVLAGQGMATRFAAGESLGIGEIAGMGRNVRLLAIAPGDADTDGMVVTVERAQESTSSRQPLPLKHELLEMPLIPGGQVTGFMKNEDTRVSWETVTAPASPAQIAAYYETNLKQAGWTPVSPSRPSDEGGMLFFVKEGDLCCVRVRRLDSDGETQVALLHKQGALK
jgi:hypothetical protein